MCFSWFRNSFYLIISNPHLKQLKTKHQKKPFKTNRIQRYFLFFNLHTMIDGELDRLYAVSRMRNNSDPVTLWATLLRDIVCLRIPVVQYSANLWCEGSITHCSIIDYIFSCEIFFKVTNQNQFQESDRSLALFKSFWSRKNYEKFRILKNCRDYKMDIMDNYDLTD